jgi:hypothetical protein
MHRVYAIVASWTPILLRTDTKQRNMLARGIKQYRRQ